MFDLSKVSIILLWIGAIAVAVIWIFNLLFDKIKFSTKSEIQFNKIMKEHTFEVLNESGISAYSWGYNKT